MSSRNCSLAVLFAAVAGAAPVAAQSGQASRVRTTRDGAFLVDDARASKRPPRLGGPDSVLWTFLDGVSIPDSCGIAPFTSSVWVGEQLNNERLQRFALSGPSTPLFEYWSYHNTGNLSMAATALNADLTVYVEWLADTGPLVVTAWRSTSTNPLWTYSVDPALTSSNTHNLKVSRDGSTAVLALYDPVAALPTVLTFDGATGAVRSHWTDALGGRVYGVDCTDDGTQALIAGADSAAGSAILLDTATGTVVTTFPSDSAGGAYHISGNGNVVVVGGFNFRAFVKVNGTYQSRIFFASASEWFGFGSAVSHDGTTVAALSHDYTSGYLVTNVRIWDVASHQLLRTVTTTGSGPYQDSALAGALSDDGSRFACASWGDQTVPHPQVRVFDRAPNPIRSPTTPGPPMSMDLSPDGQYVLVGNKATHANVLGYGGAVTVLQIPVVGSCYPNCDHSTAPPVLNVNDFICFLDRFAAGDTYANCDNSTMPPVLNVLDFTCFLDQFAAGCP